MKKACTINYRRGVLTDKCVVVHYCRERFRQIDNVPIDYPYRLIPTHTTQNRQILVQFNREGIWRLQAFLASESIMQQ